MINGTNLHSNRPVWLAIGCGNFLDNGIQQRRHIHRVVFGSIARVPIHSRSKHNGKIKLLIAGFKLNHQVEHFVNHFVRTCTRAVNFVDHNHDAQPQRKSMLKHETRLRHGAFKRVNNKQRAISHVQHALHFTAEIGMARRIDNINLHIAVIDSDIFRKNGNAAFTFLVVAIKNPFFYLLICTKCSHCVQQAVDKCCFPVVYVRNNCHITDVFLFHKNPFSFTIMLNC